MHHTIRQVLLCQGEDFDFLVVALNTGVQVKLLFHDSCVYDGGSSAAAPAALAFPVFNCVQRERKVRTK